MKGPARSALVILAAVLALAAGFWLYSWNRSEAPDTDNMVRLMAASLPDVDGKSQALSQWQGKVVVVNFWATWCPPCLDEIPEFVRMQKKLGNQGLQFVGIAIDNPAKVREFAVKFRMNYPVLIGEMDTLGLAGVAGDERSGLPFTVILDRKGRLIGSELGGLTEEKLTAIIQPAM